MAVTRAEIAKRTRRTLLDIAKRRQRPGTGSQVERVEGPLRQWPDLSEILRGIPWAVVGGVATRRYMPERGTADLDIVVSSADFAAAEARLRKFGYTRYGPALAIGRTSWRAPDGTPVDLIEGREAWWREAIEAAQQNRDAQGLPVLTLPFLVLMKAFASRPQDLADVSRMLALATDQGIEDVRQVIRRYFADYEEDLESLIEMGRLELQRPATDSGEVSET